MYNSSNSFQSGVRVNVNVNERIYAKQMRCIDEDGKALGVFYRHEALRMAKEQGVDLIEIAPTAHPPVCKLMEYGKYVYEQKRKEKEHRQTQKRVKESVFHPTIDENDLVRKINQVKDFLSSGHPVHIAVLFRGRERAHVEFGWNVVNRILDACRSLSSSSKSPLMQGNTITFDLFPGKKVETSSLPSQSVVL